MVIQEFNDPVPHIIIDQFLGQGSNKQILDAIENHLPQFSAGKIQLHGNDEINTNYKRNGNIWLDSFDSAIVNIFRNHFFSFNIIKNPELDHTNKMHEVLLSQYVDGDFYEWHTDLGGAVTWNYFAFAEPKQFNGGEFCLSDALIDEKIIKNVKEIDPQNDRLVIFPAKYQHQVKQIQSQWTEPMANRYTVQVFFR